MDSQKEKENFCSVQKLFVALAAGAAFLVLSCGNMSEGGGGKTIPKSAEMPRKSVTVSIPGDTLLTAAQQDTLLALARRSIAHFLRTGSGLQVPQISDSALAKPHGCLIKLTIDSVVRGTSGYILPVKGIAEAVCELAMRAATGARRYSPLKPKELGRTVIQISVVSDPVTITSAAEVKVKQHGLVLKSEGEVKGVFLVDDVIQSGSESVAIERLLNLCGLMKKDWPSPQVTIQTFFVQVFQERP